MNNWDYQYLNFGGNDGMVYSPSHDDFVSIGYMASPVGVSSVMVTDVTCETSEIEIARDIRVELDSGSEFPISRKNLDSILNRMGIPNSQAGRLREKQVELYIF